MIRYLFLTIILISAYGCAGSSDDSESSSIVGDWYIEFERNGAWGEFHMVISESNIDSYEIGNGQIMDEWHSGLDVDKNYKFTVDGYEGTYIVSENTITITTSLDQSNTARIFELPGEIEIFSWEIGNANAGEEYSYDYRLVNGSLIVTTPDQNQLTYTLTNN